MNSDFYKLCQQHKQVKTMEMTAAQAGENHGDEWGLTLYLR